MPITKKPKKTESRKKNSPKKFGIKHLVRILIICLCIFAAIVFVINLIVIETAKPYIVTAEDAAEIAQSKGKTDCILVLGASVSGGEPSHILAYRLDTGIELYELGLSDIMLLSGDNRAVEYNEVQTMKEYVLKNGSDAGITEENIYLDYAGFSTYDSAYRCRDIFQAERIVITTQEYHLYRAVYNAHMVGLDAIGVAAPNIENGYPMGELREVFARVKDFFLTLIGYEPAVLGDPVPLVYPSSQVESLSSEEEVPQDENAPQNENIPMEETNN